MSVTKNTYFRVFTGIIQVYNQEVLRYKNILDEIFESFEHIDLTENFFIKEKI